MNTLNKRQWIIILWILLFAFQDLLTDFSSIFSYIDELPLALFVIRLIIQVFRTGRITFKKENNKYLITILLFIISGLIGNVIFQYQPFKIVLTDLITNLKFWGALAYFSTFIKESDLNGKFITYLAKYISLFLFILFIVDRIYNIYPAEYRYGLKSAVLFYDHPTYFAGVCAFFVALLSLYDSKKYKLFILMDLIMISFTLRSKAIVSALVYILLYILIKKLKGKLKTWQLIAVGIIGIVFGWSQIYFYFFKLSGHSARSVMLQTSIKIMKDYFPIGTGFATYASHSASPSVRYSPVYVKYGFEYVYELRNSLTGGFFDDQFWPIIFGQTGVIGTIFYVYLLILLFKNIQELYRQRLDSYLTGLFVFVYLMISSIAEPAFNNSVAIPLAMTLVFAMKMITHTNTTRSTNE